MFKEGQRLLSPGESVVALIDYQPQMFFGVGSHDRHAVLNNAVALARAANLFNVPVVLSTVAAKTFSGALLPEIQAVFPDQAPIDRTTMNSWEDKKFKSAVTGFGRNKIILAGLWTFFFPQSGGVPTSTSIGHHPCRTYVKMFVTDFAGSIYSANLDGSGERNFLYAQGNLTGIVYAEI